MATHQNTTSHQRRVIYNELAAEKRGLIINQTINLETIIDFRIAGYFTTTEEKQHELGETVISGLSLSNKINVLMALLDKYDKDIFTTHPNIKRHLQKIATYRNEMAHSWLDITVTFVANRAKFNADEMKLMNKGVPKIYNEKRIKALSERIIKYSHILINW